MKPTLRLAALLLAASLAPTPAHACLPMLEVAFRPAQDKVSPTAQISDFLAAAGPIGRLRVSVTVTGPNEALSRRRLANVVHLLQMNGVAPTAITSSIGKEAKVGAKLFALPGTRDESVRPPAIGAPLPPPTTCGHAAGSVR